jgi:hypothetical protein
LISRTASCFVEVATLAGRAGSARSSANNFDRLRRGPETTLPYDYVANSPPLAEIDRQQERRGRSRQRFDVERAIENLIDMTAGALSAPVSTEVTSRLKP